MNSMEQEIDGTSINPWIQFLSFEENKFFEINMIGVWVNEPTTVESYIPEGIIFLKNLNKCLEKDELSVSWLSWV